MIQPSETKILTWLRRGHAVPLWRCLDAAPLDPAAYFQALPETGARLLLESARSHPVTGRYSFILPPGAEQLRVPAGGKSPLARLRRRLTAARAVNCDGLPPFVGGWAGCIGYGARHWFERLPQRVTEDIGWPEAWWMWCDHLIAIDHAARRVWLIALAEPTAPGISSARAAYARARARLDQLTEWAERAWRMPTTIPAARQTMALLPEMTQPAFERMVVRAKTHIARGDIFQANLSQRFSAPCDEPPLALYQRLRAINPSPFAGLLLCEDGAVISSSPERLFAVRGDTVETRPIAGTRPRGATAAEDLTQHLELLLSDKERAEHIMLVDLERNDLGRVCRPGSIVVEELMALEDYSHVVHIVSNIRGRLGPYRGALDVLAALFPGGTITGCPKIRSMEIIDALEPVARGPYTGALGYFSVTGHADWNILIRTAVLARGRLYVQVGAGIVADSEPSREYAETLHKGQALFHACLGAAQRAAAGGDVER